MNILLTGRVTVSKGIARPERSGVNKDVARPSRPGVNKDVARPSRPGVNENGLNPSMDIDSLIISSGENLLPHWQCKGAVYHISFRLVDSMPQSVRKKWIHERECLIENAKEQYKQLNLSKESLEKFVKETERKALHLYSEQKEKYLDAGHGKCYLSIPEIAKMTADSLIHFDNARYRLHAWCIMPNHVHVIVEIMPDYDLSEIIHSWKSYIAHMANKILGLTESFWQPDAYNHIIRSEKEYRFQIQYVWENPEKARLKNWEWRWKICIDDHAS